MAFSNLDKVGLYDLTQRYRLTNIDDEKFTGRWNGRTFVVLNPGESATIPESQAINFAKEICTRVMQKEEKAKFVPNMNEPTWEQSQRTRVGLPMARDAYEKRILQKIEAGEETPELQVMRAQMREQLLNDMSAQVSTDAPSGPKSAVDLSLVDDPSKPQRKGREFEGVTALK